MAYKIEQSPASAKDYFGILDYLTITLYNPSAASHFNNELQACYDRLSEHPLMHPLSDNEALAARGFRVAPVMQYIAFYTVDEKSTSCGYTVSCIHAWTIQSKIWTESLRIHTCHYVQNPQSPMSCGGDCGSCPR